MGKMFVYIYTSKNHDACSVHACRMLEKKIEVIINRGIFGICHPRREEIMTTEPLTEEQKRKLDEFMRNQLMLIPDEKNDYSYTLQ